MIEVNAFHAALAAVEGSAWFAAHLASGFTANVIGWEVCREKHTQPPVCDPIGKEAEHREQVPLLRDVFGNPFRAVTIDPAWLAENGGTVVNLAQAIYDEGLIEDLPVLADALEEAGCRNADILKHCRGSGPHLRGCWALDLLLGKGQTG
jgi:hypothetical protein